MNTIYVARHGETEHNRLKLFIGQTDVTLNDFGISQAHVLGKHLSGLNVIDLIISSPLIRCSKTARVINSYINKKLIIDKRLMERNLGLYEGLTEDQVKKIQKEKNINNIVSIYNETPPLGESVQEVCDRVFEVLEEIKNKHNKEVVLIVTHGFVAKMINKYFVPDISIKDFFNFKMKNTEIKKFKF